MGEREQLIARWRGFYHQARDWFRRRDPDDETVRWLRYIHAGMLDPGNAWSMDYAIRNLPSGSPLVEIGSFAGLSANVTCHLLRKHGRSNPFFTCDNWDVSGQHKTGPIDRAGMTYEQYARYVRETFIRNLEFFSPRNRPHAIEADSTAFFEKWSRGEEADDIFGRTVRLGGPISFCYVDAVHTCDAVRREFESIDRHLERGGFILFDDSSISSPFGLHHLMREIAAGGGYDLVHQNPNFLFRKR